MIEITTGDEYKCALCNEIFTSTWSHEDAIEEFIHSKFFMENEPLRVVCDDCYKIMGGNDD